MQVSALTTPVHALVGQQIDISWTVTNAGGDTVPNQEQWEDLVYLSRDDHLDIKADTYLDAVLHMGHLAAGQSYLADDTINLPLGMTGSYYLFVITNPPLTTPEGAVFESDYVDNDRFSSIIIDTPPPADLQVTAITAPSAATVGEPVTITWTVTNNGTNPATGRWTDAIYFSPTTTWSISDPFVGMLQYNGTLEPGQSYTQTFTANVPPLTPGADHVIIRTNIFNEVYEGAFASNDTTAAPDVTNISATALVLGVPTATTLDSNQERLFQVDVPAGQTLQITATAADATATLQLFASGGVAPTTTVFDASSGGLLGAQQIAVVPTTQPGTYYILLDGFTMPQDGEPITVLAQLVPLTITDVETDTGGDSQYVTTTITMPASMPRRSSSWFGPTLRNMSRSPTRSSTPPKSLRSST